MLSKFLQFFLPMLKDYNKRNKGNEKVFTEVELNALLDLMVKLIKLDLVEKTEHNELHLRLLSVTDFIYHVSVKRKFKDKMIDAFFDDIDYFKFVESQVEDLDKVSLGIYESLYEYSTYAINCVEKHMSLLISKTVDYLPKDEKHLKNLNTVLDFFEVYRDRLFHFISEDLKWWAYLYTEHVDDIPFSLRYLNSYGNLGDTIEKWVEQFQTSPAAELFKSRGFSVFAGWGNLSHELKLEGNKVSLKEPVAEKKDKYVHLSKNAYHQMTVKIHEHTSMFYYDTRFEITNPTHYELFTRTAGAIMANLTNYKLIPEKTLSSLFTVIRNWANKSPVMSRRRDRKLWYNQDSVSAVYAYFKECCDNQITSQALLLASHIYDICVPNTVEDDMEKIWRAHHGYLARTHNHIYYSRKKYTEEQLNYFLRAFQEVIMPKYFSLVEESKHWIFRASLEFALNVGDEKRMDVLYQQLVGWFSERHTSELNKQFIENNLPYFLYTSYSNKKTLLDKLQANPIQVVSYAGSKEVYDTILDIFKQDVENPIKTHRIEEIEFDEERIVMKQDTQDNLGISSDRLDGTLNP